MKAIVKVSGEAGAIEVRDLPMPAAGPANPREDGSVGDLLQ